MRIALLTIAILIALPTAAFAENKCPVPPSVSYYTETPPVLPKELQALCPLINLDTECRILSRQTFEFGKDQEFKNQQINNEWLRLAIKDNIPTIISPNGNGDPVDWKQQGWMIWTSSNIPREQSVVVIASRAYSDKVIFNLSIDQSNDIGELVILKASTGNRYLTDEVTHWKCQAAAPEDSIHVP